MSAGRAIAPSPADPRVIIPEGFPLRHESETYLARKADFLNHEGQVVLIKGREVLGIFPTMDAALAEGRRRFPFEGFLAQPIRAAEPVVNVGRGDRPKPIGPASDQFRPPRRH
jgi:hypothetical protein